MQKGNRFHPTYHHMWDCLQELTNFGIIAVFHQEFRAVSFPYHLLKMRQVPLVYPYPNVGLLDHQTWRHVFRHGVRRPRRYYALLNTTFYGIWSICCARQSIQTRRHVMDHVTMKLNNLVITLIEFIGKVLYIYRFLEKNKARSWLENSNDWLQSFVQS